MTIVIRCMKQSTQSVLLWDNPRVHSGWGVGLRSGKKGTQEGGTHEYPWPIHVDMTKTSKILQVLYRLK